MLLSLLLAIVAASSLVNATPEGILHAPIRRSSGVHPEYKRELIKRGTISSPLENLMNYYIIDIKIGTPSQNVSLLLDTGSSDLWVYGTTPPIPSMPMFNTSHSISWKSNNTAFRIAYLTGAAVGTWGTDIVDINGAKLKQQTIGVVTRQRDIAAVPGVMGIGLPALEASNYMAAGNQYANVPINLYLQGYINSPAYSLYLDDSSQKYGAVLFGGVDHAKYTGQLFTIRREDPERFSVNIDHIGIDGSGSYGYVKNAQLDSGTTLGLLPDSILVPMARQLGLLYDSKGKYYYIPANEQIAKRNLLFDFSGAKFSVPLAKMVVMSDDIERRFKSGRWVFGFLSSDQNYDQVLLGDVFLRNFYVVYDCKWAQIGIALAKHSKNSVIQPIEGPTIPGSKRAPRFAAKGGNGIWRGVTQYSLALTQAVP